MPSQPVKKALPDWPRSWSGCCRPGRALFYAGRSGFVSESEVLAQAIEIASANWRASAVLTGVRTRATLFIDMGSTTTDIIPVADGRPASLGYTDAERLAHGELVYSGIARSFLMAGPKLRAFCRPMDAPDE